MRHLGDVRKGVGVEVQAAQANNTWPIEFVAKRAEVVLGHRPAKRHQPAGESQEGTPESAGSLLEPRRAALALQGCSVSSPI